MLTAKEAREFLLYCAHNPIDDQSNHHLPLASLQSTVSNMMGGKTKLQDFLLFKPKEEPSLEDQIAYGDW